MPGDDRHTAVVVEYRATRRVLLTTGSSCASSEANVVGPSVLRRGGIMAGVGVRAGSGWRGSGDWEV